VTEEDETIEPVIVHLPVVVVGNFSQLQVTLSCWRTPEVLYIFWSRSAVELLELGVFG
jgi:hypothetical protein